MSPPARAHLFSLSLVLGLTVSLVWGQTPTSFTLNKVAVTGSIAITSVGSGTSASPSLVCHVTNPINTVWLFPDESIITQVSIDVEAMNSFIFRRLPTSNIVLLRRGSSVLSPVGEYCCGSATDANERLCINLVVDCGTPPSISNGSPGTTTSTLIGETVSYTCNNGYVISSGMAIVSCLASGNWETVPTCSAVDCGPLTDPTNGGVSTPSGTTFMNIATYSCDNGYMLNGDMTRTCGSDVAWTLTKPSCSLIDCGSLTDPTNGGVTTPSGTTFINTATATYSCDNGYTLTGAVTRTCGSNGMWTPAEPTCPLVDCGPLTDPTNGGVTTSSGTTFMSTATYSCDNGYTLTGDMTRTCESSGVWTPAEPSCPPVECGMLNGPTNGRVTTSSGTTFMNIATYSCTTGYTLTGHMTRTCSSDGVWTLTEPSCPAVDCGTPPSISNVSPGTPTKTTFGGTVTYTCNNGYEISSGVTMATAYCLATGNWQTITCSAVDCGPLNSPNNGEVSTSPGTTFMNTATYSCKTGYTLTGAVTRTCGSNGMWTPTEPTCPPVDCGSLNGPTNGGVTTSSGTTFMNIAIYSCTTGYNLTGDMTRTCGSDGMWTLAEPSCPPVVCGTPPSIFNGSPGIPTNETFEGTVTYTCTNGYQISSGVSMATASCMATGNWETVNCLALCPDLRPLMNGAITYQPAGTVQLVETNATHNCTSGYRLSGGPVRVCQSDRTWSGDTITCLAICPALQAITNGNISYSSADRLEGGTAVYSCTDGFLLSSGSTRTCEDSESSGGVWNGMEPSCLAICPVLTNITNGVIFYSNSSRVENSVATYSCTMGLNLLGEPTRTCQNNQTWSGKEPYCQRTYVNMGSITFASNNTNIEINSIGEGASNGGLTCFTDLLNCCNSSQGEWLFPNATKVLEQESGADIYMDRGKGFIRLNRRNSSTSTTGEYCCVLPTVGGMETFCVNVIISAVGTASGSVTWIAVGVVVALVAFILVAVVIIIIVLFFRRSHKKRKYEPTGDLHGYSTTYSKTSTGEHSTAIQKLIDPSIVEFPSDMKATEGEEVYLKVKVTGHPLPTITWYCNGTAVMADYATVLNEDGGISFPCIETKHSGVYKMVATGQAGASEEKQLELTVLGEGERTDSGDSGMGPSDYKPVPVPQFGLFVNDCHGNSNQKFRDLYKSLDSGENGHTTIISKQNKDSNRFGNISVYDDNMIVLQPITGQEDCQSNYINASYVDGYSVTKKFIAAQGPVPSTLVDFWRMIWEERPTTIVMVTNLKEREKIKCQLYWPESGKMNFGPFTVIITDQQVFADYTVRTFKLSLAGDRRAMKVTQFHFTSWPDHGVPEYATPVLAFHRRVRSHHNPSKGPLLVHCSAGVGRTGTYIVLDNVLEQIEAEMVVDISGAIVRARNQRMKLVQTENQYVFIHDAILEFVTCGNTQISAGDLRNSIQKLSRKDSTKHITGFEQQFKILEQVSPNPNEMNCVTANRHLELNRGNKFLPSENSRLILKGEQPDYINAVFAHGYKHQKAFIIAQNPLPSTVRNFWKVIYDRKCAAVVMLSPIVENKKEVCSQYWPENGVGSYGEYTVENLGDESFPGFTIRSLSVLDKKSKSSHQVTQFHVTNWTEDGVIANLKIVTDVNEEVVKVQRRTGNKPILVHCTDTVTRSGIFCAISTTIDRCKSEGVVDVFQVVKALRVHKPGAVPTEEVYQTVFGAILVFLDSFDTYANFS